MTTPNIDELIDRLYDWHNTSAEQNRLDMQKAADLLQSQAERIKELEAETRHKALVIATWRDKHDTLRAQLAAIAATAPVAAIDTNAYEIHCVSHWVKWIEPIGSKSIVYFKELPIGTKLFTRPMPAESKDADLLQSQAERIKELEASVEHWKAARESALFAGEQMKAELAAIAATEPVAYRWVWKSKPHDIEGWCYTHTPPNHPELQEIEKLFTRPMPAESNVELVDAAYDKLSMQVVERYRLEKSIGGFWPYCVKAGDGAMDIFVGSKKQAERVRQALQTACLDGAFMMSNAALSKYKGAK